MDRYNIYNTDNETCIVNDRNFEITDWTVRSMKQTKLYAGNSDMSGLASLFFGLWISRDFINNEPLNDWDAGIAPVMGHRSKETIVASFRGCCSFTLKYLLFRHESRILTHWFQGIRTDVPRSDLAYSINSCN